MLLLCRMVQLLCMIGGDLNCTQIFALALLCMGQITHFWGMYSLTKAKDYGAQLSNVHALLVPYTHFCTWNIPHAHNAFICPFWNRSFLKMLIQFW